MASFPKIATDFDAIIQADRNRRKNEDLAKEIFGRAKQKDNKKKDDKRASRTSTPSLASRMGVAKRSSSTSSNTPSPRLQNKPRSSLPGQSARANLFARQVNDLAAAADLITARPIDPSTAYFTTTIEGSGISIKGASGPFVLHASNFAPGTTAADIESAIHPDTLYSNGISSLVSCKLVSAKPDVVAELVFTEKAVAETVIAKYNGQKADGRILRVALVRSGVGSMSKAHGQTQQQPPAQQQRTNRQPKAQPQQQQQQQQQQQEVMGLYQEPTAEFEPEIEVTDTNAMEDIEMDAAEPAASTTFSDEREAADRDRRDRDSRQYYDSNSKRPAGEEERRRGGGNGPNNRDRDHGRDRDRDQDRDRDRDRNRDRDRDRDRDREGDRDRDNRDRPEYQRQDSEARRGTMSSHYGNGVGGVGAQRGGFGGSGGGGGGWGRGGPGNYRGGGGGYGRGTYRGGFRGYR